MTIKEITPEELNPTEFIAQQVQEISTAVGDGLAINALSGGVDSSTVTMLGHKALGDRLLTYFVENGIMRQGEPQRVVALFEELGVPVKIVDARQQFFDADHADVLQDRLQSTGEGERRETSATRHDSHRCGRDRRRNQTAAQHPGATWH
jgi:NH3-dependent NAD+ synthetase